MGGGGARRGGGARVGACWCSPHTFINNSLLNEVRSRKWRGGGDAGLPRQVVLIDTKLRTTQGDFILKGWSRQSEWQRRLALDL